MKPLVNPIEARHFWEEVARASEGRVHVTEIRVHGSSWAEIDVTYTMRSVVKETMRRTMRMSWPVIVADYESAARHFLNLCEKWGPGHI